MFRRLRYGPATPHASHPRPVRQGKSKETHFMPGRVFVTGGSGFVLPLTLDTTVEK